ncbi:hypothetical protein O1D97_03000 [Marinomonas sp. 15G1-11]|uniref:Uncharacterized protein n=1 Tax=Marinomonas phaeophyticola TaxID=3004091 RepID=A0ABT4JQK0_9GAMM|nr:hypothetical protein [Marinomonas sp. 15G1-11]MCZ2720637.1 hypothetical protein [Marinomonas sp. 15G1-11]
MFWELVATVFAGISCAGIALFLRSISRKKLPSWLIPAFAGIGMLGFQIQSEYTWYDHQVSLLPQGVVVIKTVEEEAVWRPWRFFYPQTSRFIAADIKNAATNSLNTDVILVDLYFFERRHLAKRVPQVIHCGTSSRADFTQDLNIKNTLINASQWTPLEKSDPLLVRLCQA